MQEKLPEYVKDKEAQEIEQLISRIENKPENQRIDPRDFKDIFDDPNEIENDIASSERLLERFKESTNALGEREKVMTVDANLVETMVPEAIKKLGWLGYVKVIKPSLYDDFVRHIDTIVQIQEKEVAETIEDLRCLGFSIDFTISPTEARENVIKIAEEIARGYIPSAKYFKTEFKTKNGTESVKLKNFKMPRIVIACDKKMMEEAKSRFVEYIHHPEDDKKRKEAQECDMKFVFIYEAMVQIEYFGLIAKQVGNVAAERKHAEVLEAFKRIIAKQGIDIKTLQAKTRNDHAFREIITGLTQASNKVSQKPKH